MHLVHAHPGAGTPFEDSVTSSCLLQCLVTGSCMLYEISKVGAALLIMSLAAGLWVIACIHVADSWMLPERCCFAVCKTRHLMFPCQDQLVDYVAA